MLQSSCSHLCAHLPGKKPLKPKRIFGPKGAWEAKATNVHSLGSLPPIATRRHEELLQAGVDVPVTATAWTIKHRVDSNRTVTAAHMRRELEKQQQIWHATIQCHDSKTGRNINSNEQEETSTATTLAVWHKQFHWYLYQLFSTNMLAGPPWCCGWEVVEMHLDPRRSTQGRGDHGHLLFCADLQTPGDWNSEFLLQPVYGTCTHHTYISSCVYPCLECWSLTSYLSNAMFDPVQNRIS